MYISCECELIRSTVESGDLAQPVILHSHIYLGVSPFLKLLHLRAGPIYNIAMG